MPIKTLKCLFSKWQNSQWELASEVSYFFGDIQTSHFGDIPTLSKTSEIFRHIANIVNNHQFFNFGDFPTCVFGDIPTINFGDFQHPLIRVTQYSILGKKCQNTFIARVLEKGCLVNSVYPQISECVCIVKSGISKNTPSRQFLSVVLDSVLGPPQQRFRYRDDSTFFLCPTDFH